MEANSVCPRQDSQPSTDTDFIFEANNEGDERPASECSSLQTDSGRGLSVESEQFDDDQEAERSHMIQWRQSFYQHSFWRERLRLDYHIDPRGRLYFLWMGLVSLGVVYNAFAIPARGTFQFQLKRSVVTWLLFDYLFDMIYLLDIFLIQLRLSYRVQGVLETDPKLLASKYMNSRKFWLDVFALTPLDLFYIIPALRYNTLLRLPRLLKLGSWTIFQDRFKSWTPFPHLYRAVKLVALFFYAIHLYTCVYYFVSRFEGFSPNSWVYDGNGISYIRCFYWATITVVTSHNLDRISPNTSLEYIVDMFGYLIGIFILALVIGEVRNITEAFRKHKTEAYGKWDRVKEYLRHYHIPSELQQRVLSWYDNVLLTEKYEFYESRLVDTLPVKMKADLAIHIHLDTLSKVSLFKGCDKQLLSDLVLKLRPLLFVPGDFICRKGEIGKEMYIVKLGKVQVIGGGDNEVLAELGPGAVFGEISLLGVGGGNRRTVHVRSKGFSKLFVLSKKDLQSTLVDYPEAQEALLRKSQTQHQSEVGSLTGLWVHKSRLPTLKKGRKNRRVTPVDYLESGRDTPPVWSRRRRVTPVDYFESGRDTPPVGSRRRRVTIVEDNRRERQLERSSTLGLSISSCDTGFSDDSFLSEF